MPLCLSAIGDIICFGHPRTAHDYTAVLYVIENMQKCSSVEIDFNDSGIREDQIRTLTDALHGKHGKIQVIVLDLNDNKLTDECVTDLFHKASSAFQSLKELYLSVNRLSLIHI